MSWHVFGPGPCRAASPASRELPPAGAGAKARPAVKTGEPPVLCRPEHAGAGRFGQGRFGQVGLVRPISGLASQRILFY
jgi:hypothetical protein